MKYNNWEQIKLGDIVTLKQGFAVNSKSNHYVVEKGIPLLKISDLFNGTETMFVKENIPKQFLVYEDEIIYSRTGNSVGYAFMGREGAVYNNCFKVIPNKKVDSKFLYQLLNTNEVRGMAQSLATGTAQPDLNHGAFKSIKTNLPPLPIQKKIAKILSNYDDLIKNNLKHIKLLEEKARLTYEEWFFRFRVNGIKLEIDVNTGVPFGWKKKSISSFEAFKQDKSKVREFNSEKRYLATADVDKTFIVADGEIISWKNKPSRAQIAPSKNSVWFARMSATRKVLCLTSKDEELRQKIILSSGFAGFKAKSELCLPFLYYTINSNLFHELKDLYATGATQVSLNNESMKFMKLIEPDISIIEKFGEKILPIVENISILGKQNQLLKEARDILLPRLMTGMIDIEDMEFEI